MVTWDASYFGGIADCVAEVTGPYGPVAVSEQLIQRLWARGVFTGVDSRVASGKRFRLLNPGRVNRQEGPDFLEAEWELDGVRLRGDVEIHFYEEDWRAHGHHLAERFSGVRLHAVVFPPKSGATHAQTCRGVDLEIFTLLPHLPEDLETTALEDALMRGEARPECLVESLLSLPERERADRLRSGARERWGAKLDFAIKRVRTFGVERALHGMFLETLGLRRNRGPMSELAARHSPADFARREPEEFFAEMAGKWKVAGVRPANHPLARLHAYSSLIRTNPDWMRATADFLNELPMYPDTDDTAVFRKRSGLRARREHLKEKPLGGAVGGSRFDTVVVDALLPWHAAVSGRDLFPLWRHWPVGDAPDSLAKALTSLGFGGREAPAANGHFQGLLSLALHPEF